MAKEKSVKTDKTTKGAKEKDAAPERDFGYTQNREISWLRFDDRVLDEAFDEQVPLFERLKFCEIFDSNLNEWFMIRVGGLSDLATLKNQPKDNKSNETPAEQLGSIFAALPPLVERHERAVALVEGELAKKGLVRVSPVDYTDEDLAAVKRLFDERLSPIVSRGLAGTRAAPTARTHVRLRGRSLAGGTVGRDSRALGLSGSDLSGGRSLGVHLARTAAAALGLLCGSGVGSLRRRGLSGSLKLHLALGGIVGLGLGPASARALGLLCGSGVRRIGADRGGLLGLGLGLGGSGGLHLGLGAAATTLGLLCRLGHLRGGLLRHGDSRRLDTRCGGLF